MFAMRFLTRLFRCSLAAVLLASAAANPQKPPDGQQDLPPLPEVRVSNLPQPEQVSLFNNAKEVVEPSLISGQTPPLNPQCNGEKQDGSVKLSFVVDANGNPRNIIFKRALGNQIDLLALQILLDSKFMPATLDGSPVAFGQDVELHLRVCIEKKQGTTEESIRLRAHKEAKISNWDHPPTEANLAPLHIPADAVGDAEKSGVAGFTPPKAIAHQMFDANGMSGIFSFGTLVDEHGIDHIEKVLRSTNQALLPIAAAMIQSNRQIPAMKNGMPVPVHLTESLEIGSP